MIILSLSSLSLLLLLLEHYLKELGIPDELGVIQTSAVVGTTHDFTKDA